MLTRRSAAPSTSRRPCADLLVGCAAFSAAASALYRQCAPCPIGGLHIGGGDHGLVGGHKCARTIERQIAALHRLDRAALHVGRAELARHDVVAQYCLQERLVFVQRFDMAAGNALNASSFGMNAVNGLLPCNVSVRPASWIRRVAVVSCGFAAMVCATVIGAGVVAQPANSSAADSEARASQGRLCKRSPRLMFKSNRHGIQGS